MRRTAGAGDHAARRGGEKRQIEREHPEVDTVSGLVLALLNRPAEPGSARRDYHRTIDKTIAEVRALYPEDRGRQDLLFPSVDDGRGDGEEERTDVEIVDPG